MSISKYICCLMMCMPPPYVSSYLLYVQTLSVNRFFWQIIDGNMNRKKDKKHERMKYL